MNQVWKIALGVAFGIILAPIILCSGCGLIASAGAAAGGAKAEAKIRADAAARTEKLHQEISQINRDGYLPVQESSIFEGAQLFNQPQYDQEPKVWGICRSNVNWIGSDKVVMIEDLTGKVAPKKLTELISSPDPIYVKKR